MRKLRLVLTTTLLTAATLELTPPAGAAPPPPPGDTPSCARTVTTNNPQVVEGTPAGWLQPSTAMVFTVTTTGCLALPAEVAYHVADRRAPQNDFFSVHGMLSWPAGNGDLKTIVVRISQDSVAEFDEAVDLMLCFDPIRVRQPSDPGGHGIILNDDPGTPEPELPPIIDFVCK